MRQPDPNCRHWWILDSHNHGVCKLCGSEKDFPGTGDILFEKKNPWRSYKPKGVNDDPPDDVSAELAAIQAEMGGRDMPAEEGKHVGTPPVATEERVEVTAEDVNNGTAPFTMEELSLADKAGTSLEVKSKNEQKRHRHNPDGKLKEVTCTWPDCNLGAEGGAYKCDPRGMHLHVMRFHQGIKIDTHKKSRKAVPKVRRKSHNSTPDAIVEKMLKLFDGGMKPPSIIGALKKEDGWEMPLSTLYTILNRERPDRKKQVHRKLGAVDKTVQNVGKIGNIVDPSYLVREVMRLVVDGAPPEEIRKKALEVKEMISTMAARMAAQARIIQDLINYYEIIKGVKE